MAHPHPFIEQDSGYILKGTVAWDGFFVHCILSRIEIKDLKFYSCCANIYWVRARFNSFNAYGEYAKWYFPVGEAKNFICILFSCGSDILFRLPWLKYWPYGVLISWWKNLGALSEYANCSKNFDQNKKIWNPYSLSWIRWKGKKIISRFWDDVNGFSSTSDACFMTANN